MVLDAVSNFVRGNTDAAVGTDDTTVSVADASIFPDPETDGEFNVVIWDANNFPRPDQDGDVEIMRVTERDTTDDELTVTRAQEMTSAAAHPEGSAIHLSPTAKMFSDIESTFGDFWDAGTQELTADVNNTNTTTQSLESEAVSTDAVNIKKENLAIGLNAFVDDGLNDSIAVGDNASVEETDAGGNDSIAIGSNALVNHDGALAIGSSAESTFTEDGETISENQSVAIGNRAIADGHSTTSVGAEGIASGFRSTFVGRGGDHPDTDEETGAFSQESIAIGYRPIAEGSDAVVIGSRSIGRASDGVVVGRENEAPSTSSRPVCIGSFCNVDGDGPVCIGRQSSAGEESVAIGETVDAESSSVSIGYQSSATATNAVSIGNESEANDGFNSVAIGRRAFADSQSIAVGTNSDASEPTSIAIGRETQANQRGIALGQGATAADDEFVVNLDQVPQLKLDESGNLEIAGEITENASL